MVLFVGSGGNSDKADWTAIFELTDNKQVYQQAEH
jgi:hypothetical protein